jgi:hypothetical protein
LAVLGAAYAYSRQQTKVQHRVERDSVFTGPTQDSDDLPPPPAGAQPGDIVVQGDVTTQTWGQILYRIVVADDGTRYAALVRGPGAQAYAPIIVQATQKPRVFASAQDAEAFARSWILSADEPPPLEPDSPDVPVPEPMPDPLPDVDPMVGPTAAGTCVNGFYLRTPTTIAPAVAQQLGPAAHAVVQDLFFYLTEQAQLEIFATAKAQLLGSDRSVRSLVTRDVLAQLRPECDWMRELGTLSKVERLTWDSAWRLVSAAAAQIGFRPGGANPAGKLLHAPGSKGVLIGREWLELPDVGAVALPLGRRVELLVGEYRAEARPVFTYPERLYARVVATNNISGAPVVRVLAQFKDRDVTPKFTAKHGYTVGDDIELRTAAPTGIRRIFAEGTT